MSSCFSATNKVTPNHKATSESYPRESNETEGMPSFQFYVLIASANLSQCVARARRDPELCQCRAYLHSTPYRYLNAWLRFQNLILTTRIDHKATKFAVKENAV